MVGTPAQADCTPRTRIGRPGPNSTTVATRAWKRTSASRVAAGGGITPSRAKWPSTDTSSKAKATTSWRHCCHQCRCWSNSRREATSWPAWRRVA